MACEADLTCEERLSLVARDQKRSTDSNCFEFLTIAASPHVRGVGNILPGLAKPLGLNTWRTHCIVSKSTSVNILGI